MRSVLVIVLFAFLAQAEQSPPPAVLTYQIKQVYTLEALLCAYSARRSKWNYIHLSTCWISLGQLAREPLGQSRL